MSIDVGDWRGLSCGRELRRPDFPAGLFIEGTEAGVVRGSDEDETARRDDGPSQTGRPVFRLPAGRLSVTPNVDLHAIFPVFTFTATSCPHGVGVQGRWLSGFQKRWRPASGPELM